MSLARTENKSLINKRLLREFERHHFDQQKLPKELLSEISQIYDQVELSLDKMGDKYRKTHEMVDSLFEALPDRLIRIARTGQIIYSQYSEAYEDEINLESVSSIYDLLTDDEKTLLRNAIDRALKKNKIQEIEVSIGTYKSLEIYEVRIIPLKQEELILILRNVTIQRKNEEQLNQVCEDLIRSNQELDDFAYIASHDLKEPLRGISNYAGFLLEDYGEKLDEQGKDKLNTLITLSNRMEKLIDTLLEYSKMARVDLAIQEVDLEKMLDNVLETLKIGIEQRKFEIRRPRVLPKISCDFVRISEVFLNLITNSLKYNDKENKWIEISYLEEDSQKLHYTFYIKDNGIGIKENKFETVFKIFKRLNSKTKYEDGVGAGLTIVKRIIERHGGNIWVESKFGEGTTFFFTLKTNSSTAKED